MPGPSRILEILVWYVESSELREASLTSRLETRLSTFSYCVYVSLVLKAGGRERRGLLKYVHLKWHRRALALVPCSLSQIVGSFWIRAFIKLECSSVSHAENKVSVLEIR